MKANANPILLPWVYASDKSNASLVGTAAK